jgi:hypothetical protein
MSASARAWSLTASDRGNLNTDSHRDGHRDDSTSATDSESEQRRHGHVPMLPSQLEVVKRMLPSQLEVVKRMLPSQPKLPSQLEVVKRQCRQSRRPPAAVGLAADRLGFLQSPGKQVVSCSRKKLFWEGSVTLTDKTPPNQIKSTPSSCLDEGRESV